MRSSSIKIILIAVFALLSAAVIFILCSGNSEKKFEEARRLYEEEQYESAVKLFAELADRGHAGAQAVDAVFEYHAILNGYAQTGRSAQVALR